MNPSESNHHDPEVVHGDEMENKLNEIAQKEAGEKEEILNAEKNEGEENSSLDSPSDSSTDVTHSVPTSSLQTESNSSQNLIEEEKIVENQEVSEKNEENSQSLELKTPPLPPPTPIQSLTPSSSLNSTSLQSLGPSSVQVETSSSPFNVDQQSAFSTSSSEHSPASSVVDGKFEDNSNENSGTLPDSNSTTVSNRVTVVVEPLPKKKKKKKGEKSNENRLSYGSSALAALARTSNPTTPLSSLSKSPSIPVSNGNYMENSSSMTKSMSKKGEESQKLFDAISKGDCDQLNRIIHENKKFMDFKTSKDAMNPLHFAAFHGQLEALQYLMKGKLELLNRDLRGNTPLHSAVTRDHFQIIQFLVRFDSSLVWQIDQDGDNVFHLCSALGSLQSLETILQILGEEEIGERIGVKNNHGKNCLHLASSLQDGKTTAFLLKNFSKQLPVNDVDDQDQRMPLHYAAIAGSLSSATVLIEHGASPNSQDKYGDTPLHLAARSAPESVVALLIRKGAAVGALNNQQKTPMHLATEEGKDEVCYILTTNGADVSIRYQWAGRKKIENSTEELTMASQADRWGYIPTSNPSKKNNSNSAFNAKMEAKQIEKERKRSQKWAGMIANWDEYIAKKEKQLRKRLITGLPDCLRGPVWRKLIGCEHMESKSPGKYQELLKQPSSWVEQIDLDVNRSARNHIQFKDRFGSGQVALFNVLKAYSVYDKEVGYCQGMSDIAAFLLMHVMEEDVFWILVILSSNPKYDFHGRFLTGFPLLKQSFWIWDRIFEENLPRLFHHFNNQDTPVSTTFYATKWFLTVFLDAFPFKITVRIWDLFLYCGYDIVYTITFAIMKWFEKKLMVCSFDEILGLFRSFEEMHDINEDEFISFIMKNEIKAAKIRKLEGEYKELVASGNDDDFLTQSKATIKAEKKKK